MLSRVLFIICDDLAYGDLSLHGNPHVATPHLDALAAAGTRCDRHLSGPLCTPARAALMTGRHPYRTRAIDTYLGRSILDPGEPTLAKLFGAAGWQCGLFGKWHLGDTVPCRPTDLGFHEALYHTGGGLRQPANHGRNSYFDPDLMHNGEPVPSRGYCADVFADAAIDFIRGQGTKPWFCYLAFNTPHSPFEIGDSWVAPLRRPGLPETWARIYGMVANIDHHVGRVLATLDELGLADDTLVIFTSDHGPCGSAQVDGRTRYNAGLRGIKGTMYEGGIRVPFLARWPRALGAGRIITTPTHPIDLLPTLAAVAGLGVPTERAPDGVNLLPLLTGTGSIAERTLCLQWHRGNVPQRFNNGVALTSRWKWYRPALDAPEELYDLERDPGETTNVATGHPDLVAELRAAYEAWFDDVSRTLGDTPEENYAPVPIPVGDPREPAPWLTWQDWRLADGAAERWDADHPGDWLLDVRQAGPHRLTVEFAEAKTDRTLTVQCGGVQLTREIPPNVRIEQIDAVELPAGPCRLRIRLIDPADGVERGVAFAQLAPTNHDLRSE